MAPPLVRKGKRSPEKHRGLPQDAALSRTPLLVLKGPFLDAHRLPPDSALLCMFRVLKGSQKKGCPLTKWQEPPPSPVPQGTTGAMEGTTGAMEGTISGLLVANASAHALLLLEFECTPLTPETLAS